MDNLLSEIAYHAAQPPDAQMFALWRAVLSLIHVDGDLAESEQILAERLACIFNFSDEQRQVIENDMRKAGDPRTLFGEIEGGIYRAQFFRLARIVIWCDGVLHHDELAVIDAIQGDLGEEAAAYEADLRWINRKPDLPFGESACNPQEDMIKQVIYQMISFYEQIAKG